MLNLSYEPIFELDEDGMMIDELKVNHFGFLTEPKPLLAEALANTLILFSDDAESTRAYRKGLLRDALLMCFNGLETVTFESIMSYFTNENEFLRINLVVSHTNDELHDHTLSEIARNICSLPFENFAYFMQKEVELLHKLQPYLKAISSLGDIRRLTPFTSILLRKTPIRFSPLFVQKHPSVIVVFIIQLWSTIIENNEEVYHISVLDLSNIKHYLSPKLYQFLTKELPPTSLKRIVF
jgi:hypothetical protein